MMLAGSQSLGCDLKVDSESGSVADSTTGEAAGATTSSTEETNDAKKDDSGEKKSEPGPKKESGEGETTGGETQPDKEPSYSIVANRGGGSGCKLGEGGDATVIVTNAEPGGPVNYGQWTFDALGLNTGEDKNTTDCTLTLELAWTPGYRVRVKGTELSSFIEHIPPEGKEIPDEDKPKEGKGKKDKLKDGFWRGTSFGFSNQAPLVTEFLSEGRFEGESTELGAMGMVSDCSGKGEWTAKLELGVSANSKSEYALSYDVFSVLFDGLEKCP